MDKDKEKELIELFKKHHPLNRKTLFTSADFLGGAPFPIVIEDYVVLVEPTELDWIWKYHVIELIDDTTGKKYIRFMYWLYDEKGHRRPDKRAKKGYQVRHWEGGQTTLMSPPEIANNLIELAKSKKLF